MAQSYGGSYRSQVDGSFANGLATVPWNGFVAELHENEEILTADDPRNQNNRRGINNSKGSGSPIIISNPMIMDDYGVDRLMDRIMERMAALGVN